MQTRIEYTGEHSSQHISHLEIFKNVNKKNESNVRQSPFWHSNLYCRAPARHGVGHDGPSPDDDKKADGPVTVVDVHDTR